MFAVNTEVTARHAIYGESIGGYGGARMSVEEGTRGRVTREGTNSSLVRWYPTNQYGDARGAFSMWADNTLIEAVDGLPQPEQRKLGQKPEGDEYLDPRDPRLDWFWDDVSRLAPRTQYCDTFDRILSQLGLPPRKKEFTARAKLDGFTVTGTVMARTQAEADQMFQAQVDAAIEARVAKAGVSG